ncbi:MAG: EAL domain-containing protein [Mycolicibacterium sp.]|nr:EAL domain-containing protein [Mycolicibacterium sp.]
MSAAKSGNESSQPISQHRNSSLLTPTSFIVPRRAQLALAALLVGVIGYGVLTTARSNVTAIVLTGQWLYPALMFVAAAVVAARAWSVSQERWAWWLIAAGMFLPAARNMLYAAFGPLNSLRPLWLCFYLLLLAGLLLLLRARVRPLPLALSLDALIAGSTLAAVAAIAFHPYRTATSGSPIQVILALAFPAGDLLLVALAAGALAMLGWRADKRWALLVAGFLLYAVADVLFMFHVADGTYFRGSWFDAMRPAAAMMLAAASWVAPPPRRSNLHLTARGNAAPQVLFTIILMGLLVAGYDARLPRMTVILAAVGLVAVAARFAMAFREVSRLVDSHRHAMTDDLTTLGNRRALSSALATASIAYSAHAVNGTGPALLLMDLDRFKAINDAFGHHVGDELLRRVGQRLSHTVRSRDLLARVGGDEFAILMPIGTDLAAAEGLAARVAAALAEPFVLDEATVEVEASIGVALCPAHCGDPEDLLQRADVAMYRAKELPARIASYDSTYDSRRIEERRIIGELRSAMTAGQMTCHYQPKIRAGDGSVHSVEALVRWQHPTDGLMKPDEFLDYVERGGLMRPLATAVLNVALGRVRAWREQGVDLTVAVNLSATNLLDVDLVSHIGDLLRSYDVPADALILELTEGVLTSNSQRSHSVVEALQRLGIKLSIDDFGTGWSSLARLQEMTVDELKLDGVFVGRLLEDPRSTAIVRSTVALAHSLGASLVAEGVEDLATLHALREYGCDITQGYVHCPPLPADELGRWLASHGPIRRSASTMSEVAPANDNRTYPPPWTVSKSIPGAIAMPVSANNLAQKSSESAE